MIRTFADLKKQPLWFSGFLLLLFLLPLPFGANRPWASDLAALLWGGLLLTMLWSTRTVSRPEGPVPVKRLAFAAAGVSLAALWSIVQVLPLTPDSWHHPLWSEAASLLPEIQGSISVDRGVFAEALLRLISTAAVFIIAFTACRESGRAKLLLRTIVAAGTFYALYGLIAQASGSDTILWFKKWAYKGFLTSTFVNKNSYAVYAGFGILASIPWLWSALREKKTDALLAKRSRVAAFLAALTLNDYLRALVPLSLLAALALTGSRAGVVCVAIGVAVYLLAMAVHNRKKARGWLWIAGAGALAFLGFLALGGQALEERLAQDKVQDDTAMRVAAYQLEGQAVADNPWLGFGIGSFDSAFKLYRDATLSNWFHHAHNDYLEMIMDLGLPAALFLFAAIAALLSCCAGAILKRRRDVHYAALALGAAAMLAGHAFVDFSFHIPAIAQTFAALLGLGVAQSWSTRA